MKTFDCVEMKRRIQKTVLAEYGRKKDEFPLFCEFLEATESDWERQMRERFTTATKKSK